MNSVVGIYLYYEGKIVKIENCEIEWDWQKLSTMMGVGDCCTKIRGGL